MFFEIILSGLFYVPIANGTGLKCVIPYSMCLSNIV